jgi:50S ribosomal subunit-associated GTPase HflX
MKMYEHEEQNRMIDSIRLFGETVRAKELSNIPVILVLNKVDKLDITLQQYPLKQLFPEYIGTGVTNAIEYISMLFLQEYPETKILVSTLTDPVLAKETTSAIVSTI